MADGTVDQIQSPVNPDVTVTGAPPEAAIQHPEKLVKMWAPNAESGDTPEDVYAEKVHDAVLAGGTIAVPFVAPDGTKDYVALHKVPDAIKAGGHIDNSVINALSDNSGVTGLGSGVAKGAFDSMRGAADTMGGPGMADAVGLPNISTAPTGISEKIGKGAEAVLEFMLGEDALKGMSLGEKLEKIAPAIKMMEAHPNLAKVVGGAVRGGAVGGAQGGIKGEASGDALGGAEKGAAFGAAGGAAAALPGAIAGAVSDSSADAPGVIRSVLKGKEAAEPMASRTLGKVSPWARQASASQSLLTQLQPSIDNVLSDAKTNYGAIDNAAGTNVKELYRDLEFAEDKIRQSPDGSAEEARWEADRQKTMGQIDDAKTDITNKLGPKGLTMLDKADGLFKRAQALKDVQAKVFQNPNIIQGNTKFGSPETVNVDEAVTALQKLMNNTKYGAPRLEQALGKAGASDLMNEMYAAQRSGIKALAKQRVAKALATAMGLSGAHYMHLIP